MEFDTLPLTVQMVLPIFITERCQGRSCGGDFPLPRAGMLYRVRKEYAYSDAPRVARGNTR